MADVTAQTLATYDPQKLGMNTNAGQTNPDGTPVDPNFQTLLGADGQIIQPYQQTSQGNFSLDTDALNQIRQMATSDAPSAWATMQTGQLGQLRDQQMSDGTAQSQSGLSGAQNYLASTGGLDQSASERLGRQASLNSMLSSQKAYHDYDQGVVNTGLQDSQMKQDAMSMLPGLEDSAFKLQSQNRDDATQIQQNNVNKSLADIAYRRGVDMNNYSQEMQKWATANTADAQRSASNQASGKK
jgi:hypothetical protein